ncbi:phenylacetate--CoA ligase family protein [Cellulophaga omnivescoria]|uniref:CoF synthetase n=1 Tax=Cellulophaga omnivescoria TaxID=1888890 RepID=UPI0022F0F0C4|nr:CoF synthetase [Cellulophaga omnivescoria]WBU88800.1 CoF synthetase [Cellulophaga omnivescoria]
MNLLEQIRNYAFWTLDFFKGSPIKKDLKEIEDYHKIESYSTLINKQKPQLNKLLNLTVNNTNYYKKYKNYNSLLDFPVVTKKDIKDNFLDINICNREDANVNKVKTSGSTGSPFEIYQTKRKKIRNTADTLFYAKLSGFTLGQKLLYLRLWAAYYKKPKLTAWLQNSTQLDVSDLNDEYLRKLIISLENDKSNKGWLGYASGFETICKYLDKNNYAPLNCNITSIIAISERLGNDVKEKMEYYFKSHTVSRYSNVENGIIAQQTKDDSFFTINWASYIVEVLDLEKDEPAKTNKVGRIVITDLYNLATPMIRYDTGDLGILSVNDNDEIPKLKSIQGRRMDALYKTNGEILNPFTMHAYVYDFPEIEQLQFIQLDKYQFKIKINTNVKFTKEKLLISKFKNDIGLDAEITVAYVKEIPSLKSGKRKISVNLYKP